MKLFNVNIRNRNLKATFVATDFLASWFGILVYKDLTSKVTRNVSSVISSAPLILLMKSAVPMIKDDSVSTCGLR